MTKKSINKKEVAKVIETRLQENIPRKEILTELSEQYFDKKTISILIASTADNQTKEKFKTLNNILLGLLILTIVLKIIVGITLLSSISLFLVPIAFLLPIISIWFAVEVSKFKGYIYNLLGLLAFASIFKALGDMGEAGFFGLIDILIVVAIAGFSFYLGKKVFPNYGLFGPKKDSDDNIILG
jgi:hypothetical protein